MKTSGWIVDAAKALVGPDLSGCPAVMTGDQPVGVVPVGEFDQRQAQLIGLS